jgi:hypothetical protein
MLGLLTHGLFDLPLTVYVQRQVPTDRFSARSQANKRPRVMYVHRCRNNTINVQWGTYIIVTLSHFGTKNTRFRGRRREKTVSRFSRMPRAAPLAPRRATIATRLAPTTRAPAKPRHIASWCVLRQINNFHLLSTTSTKVQRLSEKRKKAGFKVSRSRFQSFKVSKFQGFKVSRFQSFKVSKFQSFKGKIFVPFVTAVEHFSLPSLKL